jgi:ribosomal protein S6--L-glutamate ligase
VKTLGFRPNFCDYTDKEVDLINNAGTIYWPTAFYADLFNTMGKRTFPSFNTYSFTLDKIRQTAIFKLLNIPHPATRVFYGKRQKQTITDFFNFPFVAKIPRGSARGRGIFLLKTREELATYLEIPGPAYIQEYLPTDRDMRVIVIGKEIALAFWRIAKGGEFRTNLSLGGSIDFSPLPREALELALWTALQCNWTDVGLDIMEHQGRFIVLEANMKYGIQGFKTAGINYKQMLEHLITRGKI